MAILLSQILVIKLLVSDLQKVLVCILIIYFVPNIQ